MGDVRCGLVIAKQALEKLADPDIEVIEDEQPDVH